MTIIYKIFKNKNKSNQKDCLLTFYSIYNLIPWMIKPTPIRIVAKSGLPRDNPPRANDTIPKIIINIEATLDICEPVIRPVIPPKISIIPMI